MHNQIHEFEAGSVIHEALLYVLLKEREREIERERERERERDFRFVSDTEEDRVVQ